jgi:hypothetical protein
MRLDLEATCERHCWNGCLESTWSSLPSTPNIIQPFHSAPSLLQAHSLIGIARMFLEGRCIKAN